MKYSNLAKSVIYIAEKKDHVVSEGNSYFARIELNKRATIYKDEFRPTYDFTCYVFDKIKCHCKKKCLDLIQLGWYIYYRNQYYQINTIDFYYDNSQIINYNIKYIRLRGDLIKYNEIRNKTY